MTLDIFVKNVALWGTEGLRDLGMANGRFVGVNQSGASSAPALTRDAEGRMAVLAETRVETQRYFELPAAPVT